jgi:diguanylate cyclase (GGDEF)-like protein/PAS domain S-box-containing protein
MFAHSFQELHDIFWDAPIGIFISSPEGRFLSVNQAMARRYGFSEPDELIRSITDIATQLYHFPEDRLEFQRRLERDGEVVNFEYQARRMDGSTFWVSTNARAVRDHVGNITQYQGYSTDINERKKAEQALQKSEEKYRKLINTSPDAIALVDENGKFLTVNPAMAKRFGLTQEELIGKTYHQVMPKELADKRIMDAKRSMNDEELIYFEDERQGRHLQNYYVPITSSGQLRTFQIISRDITKRVRDEEAKAEQKALLEAIFVNVPLVLMLVDSERRIQQINGFATQFAKRPAEDMLGLRGGEALRCLHALDSSHGCGFGAHCQHCVIRNTVLDTLEQGKTHLQVEAPYTLYLDGQSRNLTLLISSTPVIFRNSHMALVTLQDISERKQFEEQLKYLSLHDQLTGLYNRAYLEAELDRLKKSREFPITVISMDLDGLKLVNDTLGHGQGDEHLRACANILQDTFRASDIVARVGGDEFVALLSKTDLEAGEKIVNRIYAELESYNKKQKSQIPLSLSIGLACAQNASQDLNQVYKQADDFMYRDKLNRDVNARSQIMKALMAALEERDFITSGHAHRLEDLCVRLGRQVNLSSSQLSNLNLLAQVHDLGKVGIPDHILFKPGSLNDQEWEIMQQHPEKGYRIAHSTTDLAGIADLILKHHERWDGKGYPLGLAGDEIPIECRILAIADSFDAMTNDRPYRKAISVEESLEELKQCAGSQFDPELVDIFVHMMCGNTGNVDA